MTRKLITLEEAAQMLGVTPDALNEMRQRQEIFGYRDGASWKFKPEDVERLKVELAARATGFASSGDSSEDSSGDDLVLLSEAELGESGSSPSSTVIGRGGQAEGPSDSDLKLAESGEQTLPIGGSEVLARAEASAPGEGGQGASEASDELGTIELGGEVDKEGSGIDLPSDIGLAQEPAAVAGGSDKSSGSDVTLATPPSGFTVEEGSIHESSSEELVLGGSGSDITLSPGDSGIQLVNPADSGLSLEEPVELGDSSGDDSSFDLGSDSSEVLGTAADFDSDAVMELKSDDDFLLTPLEESSDEESQDSGSQVIALDEDSASFDDVSPTMLTSEQSSSLEVIDEGSGPLGVEATLVQPSAVAGQQLVAPATATREAPYSIPVVLSLGGCVLVLSLTSMMMFELVRVMWSWDEPYAINSKLMDAIVSLFP
jgi:excisionase family DNA binding protein